ncbi:1-deoxy-D-xylulose-5-phosphate synthase [Actinoalloteichus hymeniacidonis]|uniref:1-deoxy-D-xylulose-5-phosphate synthase n=1 Tax=Actinoalloteichus hymeniacidonis TaxID=340345 RepID=A0AAC9HU13_9PSEU|nr:1-deoxy-D-xylulose-5-phosphate synthase [Actinoalloteichus hymeniacidonis]AOS64490.1 deoxyxylulose-5-phosphate synthase [Actinoalloteichus hymeniacidonis]MBB5907439.1 1-deoxy-D-xylulose-5-phosphate synthase [Actinoalloteichus hymeniacidonis]
MTTTTLLSHITSPQRLKELPPERLGTLATEIREFLIDKVCRAGGHLGPNLGVVELTIALHRVFDSPTDRIVFDTGHQSYVHKILTGRHDDFDSLRTAGGLSGYPNQAESPHDHVENSHASTALSYADGLARAVRLRGEDSRVVAVIGDGALTGGLAWEAMNNLGRGEHPVVIVLNDNGRSYEPTVGGLADHLAELRRPGSTGRNLFEDVGLAYLGPVDGHDTAAVEEACRQAVRLCRPVVVHCVTEKGRGYSHAEQDVADHMHGIGVIDPETGRSSRKSAPTWTAVFGQEMAAIGATHPEVVALTAAMLRPVGLHAFAQRFPDRIVDVGIAEQHAMTSAAGLAMGGLHPVVCLYATFLNRAIDQVLMDIALHRLPVTIVLDRAGVTGPDGASHHGMWDLALLSAVPGMRVAAPRDSVQLARQLSEAVAITDGPTALRFPKAAAGDEIAAVGTMDGLDILHRSRSLPLDVLLVCTGVLAGPAKHAAESIAEDGIGVTVVDPRWLLPVNPTLVHLASRHRVVLTVEDGMRVGGFGSAVAQACSDARVSAPVRNLGLPREFLDHGSRGAILAEHGLTAESIAATARALLEASTEGQTTPFEGILR